MSRIYTINLLAEELGRVSVEYGSRISEAHWSSLNTLVSVSHLPLPVTNNTIYDLYDLYMEVYNNEDYDIYDANWNVSDTFGCACGAGACIDEKAENITAPDGYITCQCAPGTYMNVLQVRFHVGTSMYPYDCQSDKILRRNVSVPIDMTCGLMKRS